MEHRHTSEARAAQFQRLGSQIFRYGLVLVLIWIGLLKFTAYEAAGIKPLAENSPLLSWLLGIAGTAGFASILGVIEILLGVLIACRPFSPKVSAIGSLGAVVMFLTTITLLFTTPASIQPEHSFPFLSPMPGQFLLKDVILLGVSLWTAGEALQASRL